MCSLKFTLGDDAAQPVHQISKRTIFKWRQFNRHASDTHSHLAFIEREIPQP